MTLSKQAPSKAKLPLDEGLLHRIYAYSFDSRVINIGQRDGWFTITNTIQSTSDITTYNTNFYLDTTYALPPSLLCPIHNLTYSFSVSSPGLPVVG